MSDDLRGPWPPPSMCWSSVMIHSLKIMEQRLNLSMFPSLPMLSIFFWYTPSKLLRTWNLRLEVIRSTAFLQVSLGIMYMLSDTVFNGNIIGNVFVIFLLILQPHPAKKLLRGALWALILPHSQSSDFSLLP